MSRYSFLNPAIRYFILVLTGLPWLWPLYYVFSPLTIYPVYWLLGLFFDAALMGNSIIIGEIPIEIIAACVSTSAYYLLLVLNLATPEIKIKKRLLMIFLSFLVFLIVNILRIFFLTLLYLSGSAWFDFTHEVFWYFMSVVFVVLIWFCEVRVFNIKKIPFYSDLKVLYNLSSLSKK